MYPLVMILPRLLLVMSPKLNKSPRLFIAPLLITEPEFWMPTSGQCPHSMSNLTVLSLSILPLFSIVAVSLIIMVPLLMMLPSLITFAKGPMVTVTPLLIRQLSPEAMVWFAVIVVSLENVIDAASAG